MYCQCTSPPRIVENSFLSNYAIFDTPLIWQCATIAGFVPYGKLTPAFWIGNSAHAIFIQTMNFLQRFRLLSTLLLPCIISVVPLALAVAQSAYQFDLRTEPYQRLEGGIELPIGFGDQSHLLDLGGEVFNFFGRPFTLKDSLTLGVTGFGNLRVDDGTSIVILDALFVSLDTLNETSKILYKIEGEMGNRVVKVEWQNAGLEDADTTYSYNFQAWVYQRTGVVEFRYGPTGSGIITTGGPWVGMFLAPPDVSSMTEKIWIGGDPTKPKLDTTRTVQFPRLSRFPDNGTVYRLTPRIASGVENDKQQGDARELRLDLSRMETKL